MSSPGGDEVGRVSVRVLPDTSKFAEQLRRELADLRDLEIDVKANLDTEDLRRQLEEIRDITIDVKFNVERLQDDIDRATAGARADDVKVPLTPDRDKLKESLAGLGDQIDPVDVPVSIDQALLEAEIRGIQAQLQDLDNETASPEVILDVTNLKERLREVKAELAALSADTTNIKVAADGIEVVSAEARKVRVELDAISRDPVKFQIELEDKRLQGELTKVLAELTELDGRTATPEVDARVEAAMADLAKVLAALEKLDKKRTTLGIDVDANTAGAAAHIDAFVARQKLRNKITLDVDVDQGRIGALISRIGSAISGVASTIASGFGKAFSGVTGLLGDLGDAFEVGAAQAGKMLGIAAQIGTTLATVVGIGTALAVAGAAVTVAWGAAATAIAAVPGAIGLLGAAAGTVMLGLDGIKAAAKSIKPEFDALKKSVSDTFEKGLTPIFQNLATIFPKIQGSINGVASALVGTAFTLSQFITSSRGVALLETIFNNTATAINRMQPGIRDTVDGFLTLAAQGGVFEALTSAVNTFGAQFKKNLTDTLRDGSLVAAFRGLRGMLDQLAIGFSDLVKNGIEVFAAAAPGVNSFLADLTGFFNRFNWKTLGAAVGSVFEGLGGALRDVPTETIREIEDAFTHLGEVFKSPEVKDGIKGLAEALPPLVKLFGDLVKDVAPIAEDVAGLIKNFQELDRIVREFTDWWNGKDDQPGDNKLDGILTSDAKWWQDLMDGWDGWIKKVKDKWKEWTDWYNSREVPVQTSSVGNGNSPFSFFDFDLPDLPSFGDIDAPALGPGWDTLDDDIAGAIDDMTTAGSGAFDRLNAVVTNGMTAVRAAFNFAGVGTALGLAFQGMVGTTTLGMASIAATVTTGMLGVNAAFDFTSVGLTIGLAFTGMVAAVAAGMARIGTAVDIGMLGVAAAFDFTTVGLGISLAFQNMVLQVALGMANIGNTVAIGMIGVAAAFNFTNVGITLGLAFQGMVGTTTLGMASIAAAVTTGMVAVNTAFNFEGIKLNLGLMFLSMVGTTRLGMESLASAVANGMQLLAETIRQGLLEIEAAMRTTWLGTIISIVGQGMAAVLSAISGGMSGALAAVTGGLSGILGFWRTNWQTMITVASGAFPGIVGAIRNGLTTAVGAIRGFSPQFSTVGRFLMEGLKTGIMAMVGPIAAAARAVVEGALRAARAAGVVKSPSKAFMVIGEYFGEGMAIGIENSASRVADAAGSMVDSAVGAADKIADAFAGDKWASDFSAKVEQSFGDLDPTVSNKDVVGAIKRQSGDLDSSSQLSAMIAILGAMLTELRGGGGNATAVTQAGRTATELGAW